MKRGEREASRLCVCQCECVDACGCVCLFVRAVRPESVSPLSFTGFLYASLQVGQGSQRHGHPPSRTPRAPPHMPASYASREGVPQVSPLSQADRSATGACAAGLDRMHDSNVLT